MASSTLRCCQAKCDLCRSKKLLPDARMMSATSRVGRFIASCASLLCERFQGSRYGECVEWVGHRFQMTPGEMQIDGCVIERGMAE